MVVRLFWIRQLGPRAVESLTPQGLTEIQRTLASSAHARVRLPSFPPHHIYYVFLMRTMWLGFCYQHIIRTRKTKVTRWSMNVEFSGFETAVSGISALI